MTDMYNETKTKKEPAAIPVPEGHPIHILMTEHRMMLDFAGRLVKAAGAAARQKDPGPASSPLEEILHLADHLIESESHYVREENVLFPMIERHGITEPPKIMWMEHDRIRALKKELAAVVDGGAAAPGFADRLTDVSGRLFETISGHFEKENSVLFPAALRVVTEEEWHAIRHEFDELGYCCFTPGVSASAPHAGGHGGGRTSDEGGVADKIPFETGELTAGELTAVLDSLPIDISFVDKDDTVRYFNQTEDRIFPRTKAVIGRTVQNCHPKKSVDNVQQILDGFRDGTLPRAEFWIPMGEKLVLIRYFPVRDAAGTYLGCLEVTQDIAPIKKIEGQKRLL